MSAAEFGLWDAYLGEEPDDPAEHYANARLVAAIRNGQLERGDRRLFTAADCVTPRWVASESAPAPVAAPTAEQLRAQVQLLWGVRR